MRDELQIVLQAAQELPADQFETVRVTALARLTSVPIAPQESDELLSVTEAARRLGFSPDYLYRHSKDFAFTRRVGRKLLFSAVGIEKHIRQTNVLMPRRHRQ